MRAHYTILFTFVYIQIFCNKKLKKKKEIPLPSGFWLSLANREPWKEMDGKEKKEVRVYSPLIPSL